MKNEYFILIGITLALAEKTAADTIHYSGEQNWKRVTYSSVHANYQSWPPEAIK
jgi:hypothetical protein